MLNLELKNHLELNFDSKYTKETVVSNSLDANNCLLTPELLTSLLKSNKDKSTYFNQSSKHNRKISKNKEGVYLIAFRILNKEKKSLVYNYIYYNDLLYLTLIVYFMVRNHYITIDNHELGKYLVILDNKFLDYNNVDKYIDIYNTKDKAKHKS
jgi:hypothetical protein